MSRRRPLIVHLSPLQTGGQEPLRHPASEKVLGFEARYGDLAAGSAYSYTAGGGDMIAGEILEAVPAKRLGVTFNGLWAPDVAALPTSRVTFDLFEPFMPMPGVTFLSCTHEDLPDDETAAHLEIGWSRSSRASRP